MDVDDIKRETFEKHLQGHVIMLVKADYGWTVMRWTADSVCPPSDYDTAQEAAARALQLLRLTEPVTPQDWPEAIGIGPDPGPPPPPPPKIV